MALNNPRASAIAVAFARRAVLGRIDILANQDAKRRETSGDERDATLEQTPKSNVTVPVCAS